MSYYTDHRVRGALEREDESFVVEDEDGLEHELPTRWNVCPVCDGEGKHVNPSIDAHGLTREDFDDDPDFRADYLSGVYDVPCYRCDGRSTVRVVDEGRCPPDLLAIHRANLQADAECRAMELAEARYLGCF